MVPSSADKYILLIASIVCFLSQTERAEQKTASFSSVKNQKLEQKRSRSPILIIDNLTPIKKSAKLKNVLFVNQGICLTCLILPVLIGANFLTEKYCENIHMMIKCHR